MMTLDEAILHAEEVAKRQEEDSKYYRISRGDEKRSISCKQCSEEHRQLAEWLKELQELRKQTRWIPINKIIPKKYEDILIMDKQYNNIFIAYYLDNIFETDLGIIPKEEILMWMPLPKKPYIAESEEEE